MKSTRRASGKLAGWRGGGVVVLAVALISSLSAPTPAQAERVKVNANSSSFEMTCAAIQRRMDAVFARIRANQEFTEADFREARGILREWQDGSAYQSCESVYNRIFSRTSDEGAGGVFDTRPSEWAGYVGGADQLDTGDFDGDGNADLITFGSFSPRAAPIAFGTGDGGFDFFANISGGQVDPAHPYYSAWSQFLYWASDPWRPPLAPSNVKRVVGDFNNDGRDDIALLGGSGWGTVPVAFGDDRSEFGLLEFGKVNLTPGMVPQGQPGSITNHQVSSAFIGWAADPMARAVVGNFDGVGGDDIALIGPAHWTSIPIAHSNGDGTFTVTDPIPKAAGDTNCVAPAPRVDNCSRFLSWANHGPQNPNVQPLVADFNNDGRDDIALVGGSGWSSVPVAFANAGLPGQYVPVGFTVRNDPNEWFAQRAQDLSRPLGAARLVRPVAADVNNDGKVDIALLGTHDTFGNPETCVPVVETRLTGAGPLKTHRFQSAYHCSQAVTMASLMSFTKNAHVAANDFDNDGRQDLAITAAGMNFVGVLFTNADGSHRYSDRYIP